jgi:DNA-binding NtrC family response regulator
MPGAMDLAMGDYGYQVRVALSVDEAIDRLRADPVDLVIMDLTMLSCGGLGFLKKAHELRPDVAMMVLTEADHAGWHVEGEHPVMDYLLLAPGHLEHCASLLSPADLEEWGQFLN